MKKYKLYHGTGLDSADKILKHGLSPKTTKGGVFDIPKISLTPSKKLAKHYSKIKIDYSKTMKGSLGVPVFKETKRKGAVFEVTLMEKDFGKSKMEQIRKHNLEEIIRLKLGEYEHYKKISPKKIKRII